MEEDATSEHRYTMNKQTVRPRHPGRRRGGSRAVVGGGVSHGRRHREEGEDQWVGGAGGGVGGERGRVGGGHRIGQQPLVAVGELLERGYQPTWGVALPRESAPRLCRVS